ncbi:MAG TPA: hypothetical protein VFS58_02580 [Steroidobacteraceae bacterium]|nr:hypothetical protein [Steroidobacteraceae bacterium]
MLRGTLVYWLLFLIFRFRLLVIVADAAQNAMSGGYGTFAEGAILAARETARAGHRDSV